MKLIAFIFLPILTLGCRGQSKPDRSVPEMDSILADFPIKWKADSLGRAGFRMKHYSYDATNKDWLINGMTFKGYSKEDIVNWLGEPGRRGLGREDKRLIMVYPVQFGTSEPDRELIIYFDEDNRLSDIIQQTGMPK